MCVCVCVSRSRVCVCVCGRGRGDPCDDVICVVALPVSGCLPLVKQGEPVTTNHPLRGILFQLLVSDYHVCIDPCSS